MTTAEQVQDPQPEKKVDDIISRRNKPWRRVWRFVRRTWWIFTILFIVTNAIQNRDFMNAVLTGMGFVLQLMFGMMFMVLQFGALFWMMSRTKTEVIKPGDPKTLTFEDYKGQPQLLKLVTQWISLLSDRTKFQEMGGRFVTGILLYGPPGTGKTYLAKAMAGEAGVAFIAIEGSGFKAMFMGVDVLKMVVFIKKARKMAREYGACIAFIDEIDSVGASRGGVMGGGGGMGAIGGGAMGGGMGGGGALTRLLYEMDGVDEKTRSERYQAWWYVKVLRKPIPPRDWHVLFMGSTNRPDVLDPALTRPGRFDSSIEVNRPDRTGRTAVVEYYLGKVRTDDSVDIEAIVSDTSGYTPAQIMAAITKDAVRMAIFDDRDAVSQRDIDLAFQEQAMGLENPIEDLPDDQKAQIGYHEAGHAVAVYHLIPENKIVRATIVRRAGALGYVHYAEIQAMYSHAIEFYVRRIMVSFAGDQATRLKYDLVFTGTSGDFGSVRHFIERLALNGYFGPPIDNPWKLYQDQISKFWASAEERTQKMLEDHWAEVEAIAQALIERDDLTGEEVRKIIEEYAPKNGKVNARDTAAITDAIIEESEPQAAD